MRLWIFSDAHQEWDENAWRPQPPADGFDVAVVPGDVHTPLTRSLEWLRETVPSAPVVYVPGNHDFYRNEVTPSWTWEDQVERGRERARELGVDLLVDSSAEIGGVLFAGGTLWTDLRATWLSFPASVGDARKGMNDYRRIHRRSRTRGSRRITPEHTLAAHRATKEFLEGEAARRRADQRFVVVTHHPPSMQTVRDPRDSCAQCYGSELGEWAASLGADLWVHGHTHAFRDYREGPLRLVTNARGHWNEPRAFREGFAVEV